MNKEIEPLTRWEYTSLSATLTDAETLTTMNELGEEGWELTAIATTISSSVGD